jgi:hypothetical protein
MTYNLQAALWAAVAVFALTSSAASQQVRCNGGRAAGGECANTSSAASEQVRCNGGRTANGECVNTELTTYARQSSVIFSQPKISQTAFPVLPSQDVNFRYPHQLIPDQLRITPTGTPGGG